MEDYSIYDHCCQKSTASESDPYAINNVSVLNVLSSCSCKWCTFHVVVFNKSILVRVCAYVCESANDCVCDNMWFPSQPWSKSECRSLLLVVAAKYLGSGMHRETFTSAAGTPVCVCMRVCVWDKAREAFVKAKCPHKDRRAANIPWPRSFHWQRRFQALRQLWKKNCYPFSKVQQSSNWRISN